MTVLDADETQAQVVNPVASATERPRPKIEVNPDDIPDQAKREKRWVLWNYEYVDERWTKVPKCAFTGSNASSTDPGTWTTFKHVLQEYPQHHGRYAGIGFMLGDGWAGADFDHCIGSDGVVAAWAMEFVGDLASYTEVSPGGEGLKTLMMGAKPGIRCKQRPYSGPGTAVELYDHDRFFTFTGKHLAGTPSSIEDRTEQLATVYNKVFPPKPKPQRTATSPQGPGFEGSDDELLQVALASRQGEKLRRLLNGDTSPYGDDHSSADLALCNILAFWTGRDADRIDQIFRTSGLYRDKWDRQDYRDRTIEKAIETCAEVYTPTHKMHKPAVTAVPQPPSVKGPLDVCLVVLDVTRTPKRQNIRFAVHVDGKDTLMELTATDTGRGVRSALSELLSILAAIRSQPVTAEDHKALEGWLRTLLGSKSISGLGTQLAASRPAQTGPPASDGPRMFDLAKAYMHEALQIAFVDAKGRLWSERFGCAMDRREFTNWAAPELLTQLEQAADYPAPTRGDPTKPIRHLQLALKPVWTALATSLPDEQHAADLGPKSKAATVFRYAIYRLWQLPETWIKVDPSAGKPGHVERMSLASRVRELMYAASQRPPRWDRVLKGVNAFYRVDEDAQGQPVVWLAMRVDLCHGEIKGVGIPSITTQEELKILMSRYGLADEGSVTSLLREEGRQQRICVLSRALCDYLVACVDPQSEPPVTPEATPAVTGVPEDTQVDLATGEVMPKEQP